MIHLSIVMPCLTGRFARCKIIGQIHDQTEGLGKEVEFIALMDNGPMSTGQKMNLLYSMCRGRYICAVGDDDSVENDYVSSLLEAVKENDVDVVTFQHTYHVNGNLFAMTYQIMDQNERQFPKEPDQDAEVHWRLPGPLCPVRAEIAKGFKCPEVSDKEDAAYKDYLRPLLKTCHDIPRVLYHHVWIRENKNERYSLARRWSRR